MKSWNIYTLLALAMGVTQGIITTASANEVHLATVSSDYDNRTFNLIAEVTPRDGEIIGIHVDSYNGGSFQRRQNFDLATFQQGFTKSLLGVNTLSIKPRGGFDPAVGGQLTLTYLENYSNQSYQTLELSLLKEQGIWGLVDSQGQRINVLEAQIDRGVLFPNGVRQIVTRAAPDEPSPRVSVPERPIHAASGRSARALSTQIFIKESIYTHERQRHVTVNFDLSEQGAIESLNISLWDYWWGQKQLLGEANFSIKWLFTPEGHMTPSLYSGVSGVPVTFHPLDTFDPHKGGRFAVRYTTFHLLDQVTRSKELFLALIKNERGEWLLADDRGEPLSKTVIKINGLGRIGKIVGFPAQTGPVPYRNLERASTGYCLNKFGPLASLLGRSGGFPLTS